MSSARSGVCRNATRRRPSGRCRLRARAGRARRWRRDAARPRERRRRPYGVVIDLIHVAEYVCKAVPVFHRHRRHRRGVRYLVRDRDGVHWCTLVLPSTAVSSMRGSGSAGWPTGRWSGVSPSGLFGQRAVGLSPRCSMISTDRWVVEPQNRGSHSGDCATTEVADQGLQSRNPSAIRCMREPLPFKAGGNAFTQIVHTGAGRIPPPSA